MVATPPEDEMVPVEPHRPRRLPASVTIAVVVLLAIPCVALALVPTYSDDMPELFGWPFFYWYQVLWVLITPALTYTAYVLIKRSRGGDR